MNFFESLKIFKKNSILKNKAEELISRLPNNELVTKEILESLDNKTTKLVEDKDIKNNYYVYLNDTIYLSSNKKNTYARICVIAHECIHSIQSKIVQKLNFISSNIEIITFVIFSVLGLFMQESKMPLYIYSLIVALSLIFRLILEIDAVKKSVNVSDKYLNGKIIGKDKSFIIDIYKFQTKILMPLFLINLIFPKLLRLIIMCTIYYIL